MVDAVGRAPKVGRPRWQELAELLKDAGVEKRIRKATGEKSFVHKDTDDRFAVVLRAAKVDGGKEASKVVKPAVAKAPDGSEIATLALTEKHCKIQISRERDEAFANFLMERLPELYADFRSKSPSTEE